MKYNWNEETVQHFKFESFYESREKIEQRIKEFVEIDCIPEDGETEEELVDDLIDAVYNDTEVMDETCKNGKDWNKCECC
jgi:hypothetical protein